VVNPSRKVLEGATAGGAFRGAASAAGPTSRGAPARPPELEADEQAAEILARVHFRTVRVRGKRLALSGRVREYRGMDACAQCGAVSDTPCEELFQRLLALDHSRREPWGPLHGVAVACYRLQHPASLAEGAHTFPLELLRTHVAGGAEASRKLTERSRRANSHRVRRREHTAPASSPDAPTRFAFTVAEVAVDGSFPAGGHSERVRSWARATLTAWSA
jgi:hypothetical protein